MPSTGTRSTSPDPDAGTNGPPPAAPSTATTEDVRAASRATGCFWWKRKPAANQVTPGPKPCKDDGARRAVQYTSQQAAMAKALDEFEARIRNKRANELNYIDAHELQALIVAVFGPQFASKDTGLDAPSPSAPWVPRPPQARSTSQVDLSRPSGTHLGPGLPTPCLPPHSMTTPGAITRGKRHSQVAWGPSLAASLLARGLQPGGSSRQPGSSLGHSSRLGPDAPPLLGQVRPAAASLLAGDQGSAEGRGGGTALSSVAGVASVRKVAQLWLGAGLSPRQVPAPKQLPAGQESQEHPADQQQQQSESQQDVELQQQQQQLEQQLEPQSKAAPADSRPSCLTLPNLVPHQSPPSLPGPAKASPPDLLPLLLLLNMQLLQRLGPSCNQAAPPQQRAPCRSPALTASSKGSRPEGRPRPSQSRRSYRSEVRGRAVRSARPSTRQLASHSRSTTLSSLSTSRSMSDAATSLAPGPADPDCLPAVGSMLPEQARPMLIHPHPPPPLELHSPQHDVHLPVPCTLPEWPGAIAVAPASPPYLPQYEPHIQSLASHPNDSLRPAARLELEVEGEQGPQPLNHPQPLPRPLDHPPQLHNQHQPQPRDQRRDQRHHQHQEQQQKVLQQQHEHRQQEEQQGQQQQQPAQPASTARTTAATREVLAPIKISGAIRGAHLLMPLNSSPALLED
ncbi:hypothetical protein QJQ45_023514 [Haematococcus lacustris]|nr:hypothetical protein QJQ45_023514 [Haematococcus lacustris]